MATPVNTTNIPPVPSSQSLDVQGQVIISQAWQDWFLKMRNKINLINSNISGWANINPVSGVTAGTYGDATHYPIVSVNQYGQVTNVSLQSISGGGGGVMPLVTGEIVSGQPVFVIATDGSLIYSPPV